MEKKLNRVQGDLESKMGWFTVLKKLVKKASGGKKNAEKKEEIKDVQVRFKMGSFLGW